MHFLSKVYAFCMTIPLPLHAAWLTADWFMACIRLYNPAVLYYDYLVRDLRCAYGVAGIKPLTRKTIYKKNEVAVVSMP